MGQIAVLLLILGFGTFVLDAFDYEFTVLSWADDYQPWLSLGLGVLGLVILVVRFLARRGKEAPAEAAKDA
jgi:hypothetical protein